MKILILGHRGMLGHMVCKYFNNIGIKFEIITYRWPSDEFKESVKNSTSDFLINCIGSIPQKNNEWQHYKLCNILLPMFLVENFNGYIIHPSTDCEFSGNLPVGELYSVNHKRDAIDDYGISKAHISNFLLNYKNVKQIRTSIIGPELTTNLSLMSWFLNENSQINGYDCHYWNGITTLEWIKQVYKLILNWDMTTCDIIQLGTEPISKFDLLNLINMIYCSNKTIVPYKTRIINKCLKTMYVMKPIELQLEDLKHVNIIN